MSGVRNFGACVVFRTSQFDDLHIDNGPYSGDFVALCNPELRVSQIGGYVGFECDSVLEVDDMPDGVCEKCLVIFTLTNA